MTTTITERPAVPVPVTLMSPDPADGMLDALAAYVQAHPEMEPALLVALLGMGGMSPKQAGDAADYPGDSGVEDRVRDARDEMSWLLAAAKSAARDGAE